MQKKPESFEDTPFDRISGCTLFIDVDGTLVPDRSRDISKVTLDRISQLAEANDVFICSNGSPEYAYQIAKLTGATHLVCRKPFPGKALAIARSSTHSLVIGDKYVTDGLYAAALGADFIKVSRKIGGRERLFVKLTYAFDHIASKVFPYLILMRPTQWVKNILIFAPLFFAEGLLGGAFGRTAIAFAAFSAASSAAYSMNDIVDREKDRAHSTKRRRPIASGDVSVRGAVVFAIVLAAIAVFITSKTLEIALPIAAYAILNILYSTKLKHVAVVDILLVALFYLLRVVAGGLAAHVPLSPWIVLCAFFGALFVIIGKRRAEHEKDSRRIVLDEYSREALNFMLAACAAAAIITYGIWSVIGHNSPYLVYSTGFVVLALFRMMNRIYTRPNEAEAPEILVFKDHWILCAFLSWTAYVYFVFYYMPA